MLRLYREGRGKEVRFIYVEKESFFNKRLLQAFILVAGVHLFALLAVQVQWPGSPVDFRFPYVTVLANTESKDYVVSDEHAIGDLPFPEPPILKLPSLITSAPLYSISTLLTTPPTWITRIPVELHDHEPQKTIISVLGSLNFAFIPETHPIGYYLIDIRIDGKTGEVFWYEVIEGEQNQALDAFIQKVRFEPQQSMFTKALLTVSVP